MESDVGEGSSPEVKLHLGCGFRPIDGAINVDIRDHKGVDLIADLNAPWPWAESSVDVIVSEDCFEHLYPLGKAEGQMNIAEIMKRCWHVLKPGGLLHVKVPASETRGAFQDPTHVTYWNVNTFMYFIAGYDHWKYYNGFGATFVHGSDGYVMQTPTDKTGVAWVEAHIRAVK